jgi:hypothetical protein
MIYYRKTLFGSGPKLTAVQAELVNSWWMTIKKCQLLGWHFY